MSFRVKKIIKSVDSVFFDIRGYFEISVFEILRVSCTVFFSYHASSVIRRGFFFLPKQSQRSRSV